MGVARQICEHRLGSGEGALGVDHPLALAQRHEPIGEGLGIGQIDVFAEELQLTRHDAAFWSSSRKRRRKKRESTRTERKKPGLHGTQRSASGARPPPGTMPCTWG